MTCCVLDCKSRNPIFPLPFEKTKTVSFGEIETFAIDPNFWDGTILSSSKEGYRLKTYKDELLAPKMMNRWEMSKATNYCETKRENFTCLQNLCFAGIYLYLGTQAAANQFSQIYQLRENVFIVHTCWTYELFSFNTVCLFFSIFNFRSCCEGSATCSFHKLQNLINIEKI